MDPITLFIATSVVGAGAWIAKRRVAQADERRERVTAFLRQMLEREGVIRSLLGRYHLAGEEFATWKVQFRADAKMLEKDFFWRRRRFEQLTRQIGDITPGEVSDTALNSQGELAGVRKLLNAIEALNKFLR